MEKAQVVICKCGSLIAACMEPLCYQDEDWQKDIRYYSQKGYEIKMIGVEEVRAKFDDCKCESKQTQLAL